MDEVILGFRKVPIAVPSLGEEEWLAVRETLGSGWLTQGPKVSAFEKAFAERHCVKYALATTSCTTGLHLALLALGVGPGDEVIVPAFTWIATANAVVYCGATPVFCDVDLDTFNIALPSMLSKITKRTKAIIGVHLFGLCADIDAIRSSVPATIKIVEDAACAAGAAYKGRPAGTLGDIAAFSFHPRKSITTGEGGMVTTNDPALARTMEIMRNHGAEISEEVRHHSNKPYILPDFKILGFNYRMTDLQAAVGIVQLKKLNVLIAERQKWAEYYHQKLAELQWLKPQVDPGQCLHAWQAFVCYVDPKTAPLPRNRIMELLQQQGIATRPGTHALHMLSYYKNHFGLHVDDFPGARDCNDHTMAIPLHNCMTKEDYDHVIQALVTVCAA